MKVVSAVAIWLYDLGVFADRILLVQDVFSFLHEWVREEECKPEVPNENDDYIAYISDTWKSTE